jgi:methyl-accepting chemotaxis protein
MNMKAETPAFSWHHNMPYHAPAVAASAKSLARLRLETRGALTFALIILAMTVIASVFQYLGGNAIRHIVPTALAYGLVTWLGFAIYLKKKTGEDAAALSWAAALLLTAFSVFARYNYALSADWRYAVEGIHIHAVAIVSLIALQFLYHRRIYLTFFFLFAVNWVLFLYLAHYNGVEMHMVGIVNGVPLHGRVVILVQLYFFLMVLVIGYINYRNIPAIEDFDALTTEQRDTILGKSEAERRTVEEIRDRMDDLFAQLDGLNGEIAAFNNRLQAQASTFEEISAAIEEITSTSERIAAAAARQVEGSAEMEFTLGEFFEIKDHTKARLNMSLDNIGRVLEETRLSTEIIGGVEESIREIRSQGAVIAATVNSVIGIADEINMLSLNASIEAARAGNQGRGFAVVAKEIGRLASQSAESVKKIHGALEKNAAVTGRGADTIQQAAESVKRMIVDIMQSSEKINELRDNIFLEEKFLAGIDRQMKMSVQLAGETGSGTAEQKLALNATARALENLNLEVAAMVEGIDRITESASRIADDAHTMVATAERLV